MAEYQPTHIAGGIKINAQLIEAFSAAFLSHRYDEAKATPAFHREAWELYASDSPQVAVAAPRNHAKTTALTLDFIIATVMFRAEDYIMILGSSEEMASEHLQNISNELHENDRLQVAGPEFKIKKWLVDQKTEIICQMADGHKFRIVARGGEQKIRGRLWNGKRPGLVVMDDGEDDEQVESKERREKFRRWVLRAAKQCLRDGGRFRAHGTILHDDSFLMRMMKNKSWKHLLYKAHKGFDDFTEILWPEKFDEARLRAIRQEFIDEGDSAGYSQEYLNDPLDNDQQFFKKDDFLEMTEEDRELPKKYVVGIDLAFTHETAHDQCAFVVGGVDAENFVHVVHSKAAHWDSEEAISYLFQLESDWRPELFIVEGGQGTQAIRPTIEREMRVRNVWLPLVIMPAMGDKRSRAGALQKRMRAQGVRWDVDQDDYANLEAEMRKFSGNKKSGRDDRVDAAAWMAHGCLKLGDLVPDDMNDEEDYVPPTRHKGQSAVCGY